MRSLKIERLLDKEKILRFQEECANFVGVTYPLEYLFEAKVFALMNDERIVGGYILQSQGTYRVLQNIPASFKPNNLEQLHKESSELTGLWINTRFISPLCQGLFWLHLFFQLAISGRKNFVFSYAEDNKKLRAIYNVIQPKTLYSGRIIPLNGVTEKDPFEVIQIARSKKALFLPFFHPQWFLNRIFYRRIKRIYARLRLS
jgi:hypothetical protein